MAGHDHYLEDLMEIIERYIVLLLGVEEKPIPSIFHLEKELFILSRANHNVAKILQFAPHSYGPYSDVIRNLVYDSNYVAIDNGRISLNDIGKKKYKELVKTYEEVPGFKQFLAMLKMIRRIYDKLLTDELLLLIYITYPEFGEHSIYYEKLVKKKKELALSLFRKGLITKKRCLEIVEGT
ncbi:MAG: hypothetical protein NDF55_00105 [archaeon GB-1867-005]|nr:hypothetical protein [Candidatus Culexmicrobium cathedralense]